MMLNKVIRVIGIIASVILVVLSLAVIGVGTEIFRFIIFRFTNSLITFFSSLTLQKIKFFP